MTELRRYDINEDEDAELLIKTDAKGRFVLHSDAVEAINQAIERAAAEVHIRQSNDPLAMFALAKRIRAMKSPEVEG